MGARMKIELICSACNGIGESMSSMSVTGVCRSCGGLGVHEHEAPEPEDLVERLDELNAEGEFVDASNAGELAAEARAALEMFVPDLEGHEYLANVATEWASQAWGPNALEED